MKIAISFFCLFFSVTAFAQITPEIEYEEEMDDLYIHVPRHSYETSTPYFFSNASITTRQVNVDENGKNLLGDAANEPSMAIDPLNPDRMVVGWRQFDTIASNFRQAGFGYTLDGGETWSFPGPLDPGVFRSDPVLDYDMDGTFYYNSLQQGFNCDVFKTIDETSWSEPVPAYGGDKQWMVIDHTDNESQGNIYAFWKPFLSSCSGAFTRSVDEGNTFEACSPMPNSSTRGTMAIGPSGELYATGETSGTFYLARSSNAGIPDETIEWDLSTIVPMGGALSLYNGPNPNGMLGQVWVAVNHAPGPFFGHVYLLATVQGFQNGDDADIVFSKSEDGGNTWSTPVRINDDDSNDHYQWFGTISVAPNGRIDVAWVDTRDHPNTFMSSLYYSSSLDGGLSWAENEKMSDAFNPHLGWPEQNKIGDYYHMISDEEGAHLAWSATFNGEQDVYYSYIQPSTISSVGDQPALDTYFKLKSVGPNPFNEVSNIEFELEQSAEIRIELSNALGQPIGIIENGFKNAGTHKVQIESSTLNLPDGLYFYHISVDGFLPIAGSLVYKE